MANFEALDNLNLSRRSFVKILTANVLLAKPFQESPFSNVPPPKFWFGDRVAYYYWCEIEDKPGYEQEIVVSGTVIGLAKGSDMRYGCVQTGWWYWVKFDGQAECLSECQYYESDLRSTH